MPEPLLPVAIVAADPRRRGRPGQATSAGWSPATRRCGWSATPETHQLVLWCMGEAHADVVLDRLRAGGVELDTEPVKVALRETFAAPAKGHGRHVKQSGGHGQYAVCDIEVEPLPRGARLRVRRPGRRRRGAAQLHPVGGEGRPRPDWSAAWSPGYPVVDLRVTLVDGKAHSVDSSDAAFQTAGALALRDAAEQGQVDAAGADRRGHHPGAGRLRRRGDERPVRPARPGARHRAGPGRPRAAPWSAPRCRPPSCSATRSSCAP